MALRRSVDRGAFGGAEGQCAIIETGADLAGLAADPETTDVGAVSRRPRRDGSSKFIIAL